IRRDSTATCTSGEPVSPSWVAYSVIICCFTSREIDIRTPWELYRDHRKPTYRWVPPPRTAACTTYLQYHLVWRTPNWVRWVRQAAVIYGSLMVESCV